MDRLPPRRFYKYLSLQNGILPKWSALLRKSMGLLMVCMATAPAQAQKAKPAPYIAPDPYQETMKIAYSEQQKGNLAAAYKALRQYIVPRDPQTIPAEAIWYAAQLAYLNKELEDAVNYYEKALPRLSGNADFRGDYGSFLMNQRRYNKAIAVLKPQQEPTLNRFYLAKTYYWQGDYAKAKGVIKTFSPQERQLDYVQALIQEFNLAKSARLDADLIYHTDDQPLRYTQENFRVSKRVNNFLEPLAELNLGQFQSDSSSAGTAIARIGNRLHINPLKTDITARIGRFHIHQSAEFLYQIQLHTQLSRTFSLDAHLSKEPYVYTIASTRSPITYDDKSFALNVDGRRLLGRFQYNYNTFGENHINNTSLWLLTPVLNKKAFKLKLGYAYQRSDADSSMYVPKTYPGTVEQNIVGVYNPYFTPANQQIHSALLQVQAFPSARLQLSASASLPLSAQIDNPYLYNFYDAGGNLVFGRGFVRTSYQPMELKASVGYKIAPSASMTLGYQYANLFFYKGHSLNLSSSILF